MNDGARARKIWRNGRIVVAEILHVGVLRIAVVAEAACGKLELTVLCDEFGTDLHRLDDLKAFELFRIAGRGRERRRMRRHGRRAGCCRRRARHLRCEKRLTLLVPNIILVVSAKEVEVRCLVLVNSGTRAMLVVELRHEGRRDVCELIHVRLVLLDGVDGSLQRAISRHEECVRILENQRVVIDAVTLILNGTVHLEFETRNAVDDGRAARDDLVHAVIHLVDVQAHVARKFVNKEISLVAKIVRHRTIRLGERYILIEFDNLPRDLVDILDLRVHLAIDEIKLLLHVLRRFFEAVGKLFARFNDGDALRGIARIDAEVVPRTVELVHLVL